MENEELIYGIPKKDLVAGPIELENGTYYNFKTYNLYVPNSVTSGTSAYIYYPGSGGSGNDTKIINNVINTGNGEQIIVIPDDPYRDKKTFGTGHLDLIENIGAANDVEISNVNMMGFSAGGPATFGTLINTIERYPNNGPHNAVFCDVVDFKVTPEQIDLLIRDQSTLMFFEPNKQITNFEKELAQAGVDVIICRTYGPHAEHSMVNKEALLNGVIDFSAGLSDTVRNSDIYTFQIFDRETGQFKDISLDEVAQKFATTSIDSSMTLNYRLANITELKSSNQYLASKVNNIRSAVKNTNFLCGGFGDSYSSTTLVPSSLGELVQSYFSTCLGLLSKIEVDTRKIIEIGEEIDRMNAELEQDAAKLNQSDALYNEMGVSQVIGSDYSQKPGATMKADSDLDIAGDEVSNEGDSPAAEESADKDSGAKEESSSNSQSGASATSAKNPSNGAATKKTNTSEKSNDTGATKKDETPPKKNEPAPKKHETAPKKNDVDNTVHKNTGGTNSSNEGSNIGENYNTDTGDTYIPQETVDMNSEIDKEFYNFEELYSNDKYLVYTGDSVGSNCKIVVHYEDNKVIGMDYYFDFDSSERALENVITLSQDFENFGEISVNGENVKVVIREDVYNDLTLEALRKNFSKFEELIKE